MKPPRGVDWRRAGWLGLVVGPIALCGIAVLIIIGRNIGPLALAIGLVTAILPVPILVLAYLWLDRYEPEPPQFLAFCFGWGACVATLVSIGVNTGMAKLFASMGIPPMLVAVLVAPVIEELTKAAGPLLLFWRRRRAFSGIVDGLVYCGLSATGFAMVENILYLGGYGWRGGIAEYGTASGGAVTLAAVFIGRVGLSGFAHPLFTSMIGIGLGIAAVTPRRWLRWVAPLGGAALAMLLHGVWNGVATAAAGLRGGSPRIEIFIVGYVAIMVPVFLATVGVALWTRSHEVRLVERVLPDYVRAGWLTPPEVASLVTVGRRLAARRWALRVAGIPGRTAMRGYQYAATRLAVLRDRVRRGVAVDAAAEERALLDALVAYRSVFTGRDQTVPPAWWDGRGYRVRFPDGSVRALPAPTRPVVPIPIALPQGHRVGGPVGDTTLR